ncbi:GPW/gp25 family protein [Pseudoxanthomonas sp. PXM02]|uniref:GPW/gp25 family protein n=1 Tax=Pseudoxanthomonas sp. PXM02 TaxID=2769294 RepID=UPI00177E3812|nr:GPW/gp25 family protein [Pseudoxanthomonas sp. PXM02]
MRGVSATTGRAIEGEAHLRQSIADILTTPLGTRVMRRDYGSLLPELIDAPFNGTTRVQLYGAVATALLRWEPRIVLTSVQISPGTEPGTFLVDVQGQRTDVPASNEYTRLQIPLNFRTN